MKHFLNHFSSKIYTDISYKLNTMVILEAHKIMRKTLGKEPIGPKHSHFLDLHTPRRTETFQHIEAYTLESATNKCKFYQKGLKGDCIQIFININSSCKGEKDASSSRFSNNRASKITTVPDRYLTDTGLQRGGLIGIA